MSLLCLLGLHQWVTLHHHDPIDSYIFIDGRRCVRPGCNEEQRFEAVEPKQFSGHRAGG